MSETEVEIRITNPDNLPHPSSFPKLCAVCGPGKGFVRCDLNRVAPVWWCMDCLVTYPPSFMVKDEVWSQVFDQHDAGFICWDCFESRLGRTLEDSDIAGVRLNKLYFKGRRVLHRELHQGHVASLITLTLIGGTTRQQAAEHIVKTARLLDVTVEAVFNTSPKPVLLRANPMDSVEELCGRVGWDPKTFNTKARRKEVLT